MRVTLFYAGTPGISNLGPVYMEVRGLQVGEVTLLGGVTCLSISSLILI